MRATTQHLQKRLNTPTASEQVSRLPIGLAVIVAWLSGAMFMLSLAPYGYWIIALLSPALLYALLLAPMSNKRAFIIGEAYGMGLWCVGAFWLYTSIHEYGYVSVPLSLLAIAVMGLGMGLFHAFLALIFNRFVGKQPLAFAALWVLQEWLKTWLFTGFPWLFVGYAFTEQYWLSSLAPVAGVFAISFVAVLLAASLVEAFRKQAGYLLVSALLLAVSIGLWLINPAWTQPKANSKNLTVSLIQGNIPQDLKWLTEYQYKTLEIYANLTSNQWDQDIIVWPESSIPMFQTEAWDFIAEVDRIAKLTNTVWLTGVPYKDDTAYDPETDKYTPFYNSVLALGAEANGIYKKQRLVPFGEYIPLEGALDLFPKLAGSPDILSYSRGDANQSPLQVKGHNLGAAVCYEVAYPDTTRRNAKGTDFLLTISNDAWFGTSAGPLQHLQMVQMRSLETGRWFLRATNTGVTAIIDHKGRIVQRAPQFERTVLRGEVQSRTGMTPYVRFGNYPILIFIGLLLLLSVLAKRGAKHR
ncbi:apolipoprotein N-acyltransferase [Psychrobacter lutiphocae]|uniref:apolipoprotein N-acyltransferase n=1 Tax=Psychrobacter lutiphocae TaxID=540500 RepID=UPI00037F7D5F|nr:apolipoprotein N-acyltransferase [Psychrobacter lutiphocae]